jgi:hypothetical protein
VKGGSPVTGRVEQLATRLTTHAPGQRLHAIVLLSLVALVEVAWSVALVYLVLHFL